MGIKYCKSCKKPMKAADTHCRTCGNKYKTSYTFLIIVLFVVVGSLAGSAWWYFSKKKAEDEARHGALVSTYVESLEKLGFSSDEANTIANLKYSEDKPIGKIGFSELKGYAASFSDQRRLSNSVMRVALAQPIAELQKIKRDTESKKYSGCLEASKLIYVSSMNATNEALLTFLADGDNKEDEITSLFTKSILQEKEAESVLVECEKMNLN